MSDFSVWNGIFESFESAQGAPDVFIDRIWIDKQKAKISSRLETFRKVDCTSSLSLTRDYPLATFVAAELVRAQSLHLLDVGGGMGEQFLEILARVPEAEEKLNYTILENASLNSGIPSELRRFQNLRFISELSELPSGLDMIHFGSSLQYVDDWRSFIKSLVESTSVKNVVISDFLAGDIPHFVTLQKYGERNIPIRMYNENDFNTYLSQFGFVLTYRSYYDSRVLNQEFLPNSALPEKYRIKKPLNLVFSRGERK
ncbi:MAG: methyltransferase, TIGR04325 family [Bdellovibrionota bacterium]